MYFVKNEQFWFPPLLWNAHWVIVPIYVMYYVVQHFNKELNLKN